MKWFPCNAESDFNSDIPGKLLGGFFEAKPCQEVFEISLDFERFSGLKFKFFTKFLDVLVVLVEEFCGVVVIDEMMNHSRLTSMSEEVIEKGFDLLTALKFIQDIAGNMSSETAVIFGILQPRSEFFVGRHTKMKKE